MAFPLWLRATHILNVLFLSMLARSGLEILSAHPRLYWTDHTRPGGEWLKLSRKQPPPEALWTSRDEETPYSSWLALPGKRNLGLGRHWHFVSVAAWILTGAGYLALLLISDEWRRLVPTSWAVLPHAVSAARTYLTFHLPAPEAGLPYNALQQLTYFAVVFLLAPLAIATGAAMSPALAARFPWYPALFGGRQAARSIHFLCLIAFAAFTLVHTAAVIVHGLPRELGRIVLGVEGGHGARALVAGAGVLALIFALHALATVVSRRWPRPTQRRLQALDPLIRALVHHLRSRQRYRPAEISPYFWVNGRAPVDAEYEALARANFAGWTLAVDGEVERPLRLSLADLQAMPASSQVTKHVCIQGWSAVAKWTGVPLAEVIDRCRPLPTARYAVFFGYDDKGTSEPEPEAGGQYYESIDLELARHPQTLLAYAMNDAPLPPLHGAPLRLRVETQLGFKMVKYLKEIRFVADYRALGEGQGGWREDVQHYSQEAGV